MIVKTIANLSATAACFGLAFAPLAAQAQDADGAATGNPLGISEDVTMMGTIDPNVRKATAVVNGAVITDTDVAHRLALLLPTVRKEKVTHKCFTHYFCPPGAKIQKKVRVIFCKKTHKQKI